RPLHRGGEFRRKQALCRRLRPPVPPRRHPSEVPGPRMIPPGLIISAPASRTGKTTVTLGLLPACRAADLTVQPYNSGPDYIAPAHHRAPPGRATVNPATRAMGRDRIAGVAAAAAGADQTLAEGSMGLFDGVARAGEAGTGASA